MSARYVVHYDAIRANGSSCTQVLERDGDGDYVTWLTLERFQSAKAREIAKGLNELERRRARNRREAARKRRERAA